MATVIDSLLVKIGLTSDKFKKEAHDVVKNVEEISKAETKAQQKNTETLTKETAKRKKITQKTQKENEQSRKKEVADNKKALETQNKDTEEAVKQQTKAAETSLSIPGMIAKRFAPAYIAYKALGMGKELAETSSSVYRLSHSLADSSEEVRTWMESLNLVGGNADEAKNNIIDLQSKLDRFHLYGEGAKELSNVFGNMGVNLYNASGQAKSALEMMEDIGKYVRENPDHLPQNLLATRVAPAGVTSDMFYSMLTQNEQRKQTAKANAKRFQDEEKANQKAIETVKDVWSTGKSFLGKGFGSVTESLFGTKTVSELLEESGSKWGVPSSILKAVGKAESNLNVNTPPSSAGATGFMQIMPKTFAGFGGTDINDPSQQADVSAHLLRNLYDKYGSWEKAVAAYNWKGESTKFGDDLDWKSRLPSETSRYIENVNRYSGGALTQQGNSSTNTTHIQVDKITVNTQATDSKGIARDLSKDLVQQANRGMQ